MKRCWCGDHSAWWCGLKARWTIFRLTGKLRIW
jgi:hypothetical protein